MGTRVIKIHILLCLLSFTVVCFAEIDPRIQKYLPNGPLTFIEIPPENITYANNFPQDFNSPHPLSFMQNSTFLTSDLITGKFTNCKFDKADFNPLKLEKSYFSFVSLFFKSDWSASYPCNNGKTCQLFLNFCKHTETLCNGVRGVLILKVPEEFRCEVLITKQWDELAGESKNYMGGILC